MAPLCRVGGNITIEVGLDDGLNKKSGQSISFEVVLLTINSVN